MSNCSFKRRPVTRVSLQVVPVWVWFEVFSFLLCVCVCVCVCSDRQLKLSLSVFNIRLNRSSSPLRPLSPSVGHLRSDRSIVCFSGVFSSFLFFCFFLNQVLIYFVPQQHSHPNTHSCFLHERESLFLIVSHLVLLGSVGSRSIYLNGCVVLFSTCTQLLCLNHTESECVLWKLTGARTTTRTGSESQLSCGLYYN